MQKRYVLLGAAFVLLSIASCKKDDSNGGTQQSLQGNYQFIGMTAHIVGTITDVSSSDIEKSVAYTDYVTKNNVGTVKIDASSMTSSNLSYAVDTTSRAYFYSGGSLIDSADIPFQVQIPATSGISNFKVIGTDSLYFTSGTVLVNNTSNPAQPMGAKFRFDGNKLYLTANGSQTTVQTAPGETVTSVQKFTVVTTLQKM